MSRSPVHTLYRRQWVPHDLPDTFAFFERPENLALITPPSLGFRMVTPSPVHMAEGVTIDYTVRVLGVRARWRSLITEHAPPHAFRDVQVIGPYRRWDHWHRFSPESGGTVIEDVVLYEMPLGPLGRLVNRALVRRQLDAIFDFRRARIATLLPARTGADATARRA